MSYLVKGIFLFLVPAVPGLYFYIDSLDLFMPTFQHIKNPTTSKFGEDYQLYLSDASNDDTTTDRWWRWSFDKRLNPEKNKKTNDLSNEFKDLADFNALKSKCEETYKKDTSSDLKDSNDSNNKNKYGRDAWKFCSRFDEKPKTIEDNSGDGKSDKANLDTTNGKYNNKIGSSKKSELVSVTDTSEANKKFWEVREIEFFGKGSEEGIGKYNTTTKSDANKKNIFDKLYDDREIYKTGSLKEKCGEAYALTSETGDGKVQDSDVVKFCGLKGKKPSNGT